jgi:hypothetical protein
MKKIDYILCLLISFTALASRVPLIEKFQSHWDGPQYTIAVVRYSFEQFTPAPPGYPLYIALGKLFYLFFNDPHKAILAVSVFGSLSGAIILYIVGMKMYHRQVGIAASTIFLTGSTFYYFGLTPYAYGLLIATTTLLAYIVYRIYIKKTHEGILLGAIIGICFAIRPQETIQIGPLYLLGVLSLSTKERLKALAVFLSITLLWFIPLTHSMGLQKYFTLSYEFAKTAIVNNSLIHHVELMIKGTLLSFGISSGFLLYYFWKYTKVKKSLLIKNKNILFFYIVWIAPGLIYNLFIRTEHAGYQMSYLSGLLILISYAIWKVTKKSRLLYIVIISIVAAFNLCWFFYDRDPTFTKPYRPTSFHYSDIRKNDLKTGSKVTFVQDKFDPKKTLVISTEVLWRPYSYYLRDYDYRALYSLDNKEEPYRRNIIYAKDWNMHESIDKDFTIITSPKITTVVFIDDAQSQWIKHYPFKSYKLPGNSTVTAISVAPKTKIIYNYHSIKISK